MISIIIPFRENVGLLQSCLESFLRVSIYSDFEVLLIDNASVEPKTLNYLNQVEKISNVRVLRYPHAFNFSAINNFAVREAKGEFLLFLNNDTQVISREWLDSLLELFKNQRVGAVGAKLLYPNKTIQHAGIVLHNNFVAANTFCGFKNTDYPDAEFNKVREWNAVTAACMMTRKKLFEQVGGFDEEHFPIAYNDVDYCLKLREEGYRVLYAPKAVLYHHESVSRGLDALRKNEARYSDFLREQEYMRMRWKKYLNRDEFFREKYLLLNGHENGVIRFFKKIRFAFSSPGKFLKKYCGNGAEELKRLSQMARWVLQERGVLGLVHRVRSYGSEFAWGAWILLTVRAGDVLYISGCPGGSRKYRCDIPAEVLVSVGVRAYVVTQDNLNLQQIIKKFRVFILQRVIWNERFARVVEVIKQQGGTIIFETDDLVFDPSYLQYMEYYRHMVPREKAWYENGIGRELLEDASVRRCVVSTDFLAEAMRKKYPDKEVFVSYNTIGKAQVEVAEKAFAKKSLLNKRDGKIRIGYFSGSQSHNKDFESVSDVLLRLLREQEQVSLVIVGHLDLPESFAPVMSRVEKRSFVPMKELSNIILSVDINIAPLEIENPFCQAKSAIKFFEAGILGVPTVAAATGDFVRCIENGKNGFVARTEEEWYSFLSKLISDRSLRERLGAQARKDIITHHTTLSSGTDTERLIAFLRREEKISTG